MRLALACLAICSVGCTVDQLRFSTGRQGNTIIDVQYRQALDNIARFVAVPDSLPHFATTSTGTTQVTDAAGLNALTFNWHPHTGSAAIGGNRTVLENWTLVPMLEPDRLQAMQLAFKIVTRAELSPCDNLEKLKEYLAPFTPECQLPLGWYCVGRWWWQVPKHVPFGHYDGTYVWVRPGRMADLSQFTLTLLMIAGLRNPKQMAAAAIQGDGAEPYYELPKPQSFPQFYPQFRP